MKKTIVTGILALSSATALAAEGTGFYVIPNIGQSSYDISQDDADDIALIAFEFAGFDVLAADSSLDDSGTAWSVVGGWKFSEYFAAEIGYLNLGKAKYRAEGLVTDGFDLYDATFGMDISAKGPTAALVGIAPIGEQFDLHARLGMFFAKSKFDFSASLDGIGASDSFDASSNDLFYGIGAAYRFTDRFSLTLDYLIYKDVGDEDETGEADIDSLTLGAVFNF